MSSENNSLLYIGYFAIVLFLIVYILKLSGNVSDAEQKVQNAPQAETLADGEQPEYDAAVAALWDVNRGASKKFRWVYLLLVALPAAVAFPALLSTYTPKGDPERVVVNIRDMTEDDIGKGIEKRGGGPSRETYSLIASYIAYAVPTAIMALFALIHPDAFGGVRTWVLFAIAAAMVYCGSVVSGTMKREKNMDPMRIGMILGGGYVAVAVLIALFFM